MFTMPALSFSQEKLHLLDQWFIIGVLERAHSAGHKQSLSLKEAYFQYLGLDEIQRQKFWHDLSVRLQMNKDKIYKFVKFTWSKQFYELLDQYRLVLKQDINNILDNLGATRKPAHVEAFIWEQIWPIYKRFNLHYEATDQLMRNTVNLYYNSVKIRCKPIIKVALPLSNMMNESNDNQDRKQEMFEEKTEENETPIDDIEELLSHQLSYNDEFDWDD